MESTDKLRKLADECYTFNDCSDKLVVIADEIEQEIAERYMLKDDSKLEETAAQEYNITVQVAAGQTIEYNTELRHRCGAATSISVAFRLE